MNREDMICIIRDEYDSLMKNRDITRLDIIKAFTSLSTRLTCKPLPAPEPNFMRIYYRPHKNSEVESIECYGLISLGHIGNNHYKIMYNKDGYEKYLQIDKCNLIGIEGI